MYSPEELEAILEATRPYEPDYLRYFRAKQSNAAQKEWQPLGLDPQIIVTWYELKKKIERVEKKPCTKKKREYSDWSGWETTDDE